MPTQPPLLVTVDQRDEQLPRDDRRQNRGVEERKGEKNRQKAARKEMKVSE